MPQDNNQTFKIRFKLPSGEEFEAEGPKEFIEEQRAYFLHLTGKKEPKPLTAFKGGTPLPADEVPQRPKRPSYPLYQAAPQEPSSSVQSTPPLPLATPTALPTPPAGVSGNTLTAAPAPTVSAIWEKLFKTEDGALVLRRKSRLLTPQTAALVLIAAARILRKENEYSALHLSKSLRKSGYGEGRLDRLLLPEMRSGSVESAGSKRSRAYKLSSEGFARAVVLAEKIAEDL